MRKKVKYYICPSCGRLTSSELLQNELEEDGSGYCDCLSIRYKYSDIVDELVPYKVGKSSPDVPNRTKFVQIREDLFDILFFIKNDHIRLEAFNTIPTKNKLKKLLK